MRHRAVRAALALFVAVAVAAAAQEFCPPLPVLRLKPPLLLAVAVRYGLRRETGWAVAAALWCGLLEDALGFVPCGVSPAVFGAAALLCALVLRSQLVEGPAAVALVAGAAAPVAAFAQYLALRLGAGLPALPLPFLAARLAAAAPAGAAAGLAAALALRALDRSAGLVPEDKEDDRVPSDALP